MISLDLLTIGLSAASGMAVAAAGAAIWHSRAGQAVEADAETAAFTAAEKSVEWLSDKSSHVKAIAAEQAKMARKDQLKAQLLQKLQSS
jgi:hypothetical protein